uniref:17S U2 SnRNP complex component HTATSF1 n=1 Tax=Panagrolaimus superbus TaxID=310955 RepID=A0A914YGY8_9BILA
MESQTPAAATTIPTSSMSQQNSADDRRCIDNRWICLKDGDFFEFKENEWIKVDEDEIEDLNDKWNKTRPAPLAPQLHREVDGRWIYPNGEKFLEFIDSEWREVDPSQLDEIKIKYEEADPYRKVVNGIPMKFNLHLQQWLPEVEVNDDFVAMYQANYGVAIDYSKLPPSEKEIKLKELEEKQKAKEERKRKATEAGQEEGWTEISNERDTHVYVNNLPTDITDDEFIEFMGKAGVIMKDPRTNKPKIKLYRTPEGDLKGDGTCCYVRRESVELALTILDGWDLNKHKVHVEKAQFQMKGEFDPTKKKKRLTLEQKKKFMEKQNKAFEWEPEKPRNYRPPSDQTVILKNVFGLDEMIKNVTLALDLKEIIKERCERFGKIIKVVVYENHPDGIVSISYSTVEEADYCIKLLNRGIMRQREIEASNWDGKTKYNVKESAEDQKRRDQEWKTFLEDEEEQDEDIEKEKSDEKMAADDSDPQNVKKV